MTKKIKEQPKIAFFIFGLDVTGNHERIGAAFFHKKGNGLNIIMNEKRYLAFPPKPKAQGEGA